MDAKHTKGPWHYYTEPQPNGCPIVGSRGLMVAMVAHSINHEDQRDTAIANAQLIATAPELLAALNGYRKAFDDLFAHCLSNGIYNAWQQPLNCTALNNMQSEADRVIRKATGATP